MSRFYAPVKNIDDKIIRVEGEEAHHIINVMRLKEADDVVVFDGTGREYAGFIDKIDKTRKIAFIEVVSTSKPDPGRMPKVTLAQAVPKKQKMDYIVEKATELGASSIKAILTRRTIVRPSQAASERMRERWLKLAKASAKQCGRATLPDISGPERLKELVGTFNDYDLVLMAVPSAGKNSFKRALNEFATGKVLVIIGPEGGFSEEEITLTGAGNCHHINLGPYILKSDTAGLFVLSALLYRALP